MEILELSIITNSSTDRSIGITKLKKTRKKDLRKMNSFRDLWNNIKQYNQYTCNQSSKKRGNERKMAKMQE